MFDYSEQIAQDMKIKLSSPEHFQLFKKKPEQVKIASHPGCCSCDSCTDKCTCHGKCQGDCEKCHSKKEVVADILLQLTKLSEILDLNGFEKSAQGIMDAVDLGEEELMEPDIESEGLSDPEEKSLEHAIKELNLQPPEELPDIDEVQPEPPHSRANWENILDDLGQQEVNIGQEDEIPEDRLSWSRDLTEEEIGKESSYNTEITKACKFLDTWIRKNAVHDEDIDLYELGMKMMNWHTGQWDPVYMVASYFVNGEDYPDLDKVEEAKNWLERDLRRQKADAEAKKTLNKSEYEDEHLEYDEDQDEKLIETESNVEELEEIVFGLDQYLIQHGHSTEEEPEEEIDKIIEDLENE